MMPLIGLPPPLAIGRSHTGPAARLLASSTYRWPSLLPTASHVWGTGPGLSNNTGVVPKSSSFTACVACQWSFTCNVDASRATTAHERGSEVTHAWLSDESKVLP